MKIQRVSGSTVEDLDDDAPLPVVATWVNGSLLANLLATHTYTYKMAVRETEDGRKVPYREEMLPPNRVLTAVLAGAEWPTTPTLAGIIGTPVLRRNWSLLKEAGYDPVSGSFLAPTVTIPHVPERPTAVQVAEGARSWSPPCWGDFEWEDAASLTRSPSVNRIYTKPSSRSYSWQWNRCWADPVYLNSSWCEPEISRNNPP